MFQPHLPVRLPCYDLAPITSFALGRSLRSRTLGAPGFHGLTGGVYKARERIHRAMACLLYTSDAADDSIGTAVVRCEEGGDDVKSARPLRPGLHTCYNGGYSRPLPGDWMPIPKTPLSSDWSLQPDSTKLDSLVIAHQPRRGEYVPGPCTHRPSSHESRGYLKCVTARSALG